MVSSLFIFVSMSVALVYQAFAAPFQVSKPLKRTVAVKDADVVTLSILPYVAAIISPLPPNYTSPSLELATFPGIGNTTAAMTEVIIQLAENPSLQWTINPVNDSSTTASQALQASIYVLDVNAGASGMFSTSVIQTPEIAALLSTNIVSVMERTGKEVVCVRIETDLGTPGGGVAGVTTNAQQPQYGVLAKACGEEELVVL